MAATRLTRRRGSAGDAEASRGLMSCQDRTFVDTDVLQSCSAWTAVVRRVQAAERDHECAITELRRHVDAVTKSLSNRVEALEISLSDRPVSPASTTFSAGTESVEQEAIPKVVDASCSSEKASLTKVERDLERLDQVMAELLQAHLMELHTEVGLDRQRPPRLMELRKALQQLEKRRRERELEFTNQLLQLREAVSATCDYESLRERLTNMEERLCSTGKNAVEWELSSEELSNSGRRGQQVSSRTFSMAGVSGFKLHFFPFGHELSEEGRCALFLSGPTSELAARFLLFHESCQRDSAEGEECALQEGSDKAFKATGFYSLAPCRVASAAPTIVGVRLLDVRCRDGEGFVHRYQAPGTVLTAQ